MSEKDVCSICGRDIIHIRDCLGGSVACDPDLTSLSEISEAKGEFATIITLEGHPTRPGTAYPGSDMRGYRPHFYTCDDVSKAYDPAIKLDRVWEIGEAAVGPAEESEGGGGPLA